MIREKEIRKEIEIKFDENFSEFWFKILNHNVLHTKKINHELGSPQEAVICQVIAWHHYLVSINELPEKDAIFNNSLRLWDEYEKKESESDKKLTISLISSLSNIPYETTRRKLKLLEKKNSIIINKKNRVLLNPKSELNKKIVFSIHPYEKDLIKEFLVTFMLAGTK